MVRRQSLSCIEANYVCEREWNRVQYTSPDDPERFFYFVRSKYGTH